MSAAAPPRPPRRELRGLPRRRAARARARAALGRRASRCRRRARRGRRSPPLRRASRSTATARPTAPSAAVIAWLVLAGGVSSGRAAQPTACAGRCRRCCASASTAALLWLAALAGAPRCRPRSRCSARSPSATTTSSTACATAARRRRAGSTRRRRLGRAADRSACVLLLAGALPAGFYVVGGAARRACSSAETRRRLAARSPRRAAPSRTRTRRTRSAVIGMVLAAGAGSGSAPLTDDLPKTLLRSTATARSSTSRWRNLAAVGLERGGGRDRLRRRARSRSALPELRAPPRAARSSSSSTRRRSEWNNAYSLWCAREHFAEGVLLANGDTVHPRVGRGAAARRARRRGARASPSTRPSRSARRR